MNDSTLVLKTTVVQVSLFYIAIAHTIDRDSDNYDIDKYGAK